MKPGIPWSIKGVEPELREIAKSAARRQGVTLGEWLNNTINERADGSTHDAAAPKAHSLISSHPIERAASRLEDIAEQLAIISARESGTAHRQPREPEDSLAAAKILARVESNEKQTVEAFSAVNERLATISRQITRAQPTKVEESPGYQAMEKAVRNIVEHLEVSDKRTRENMKSLQERMGDMTSKVTNSTSEQLLRQAPAFNQLEQRLAELAKRVEQPQQANHSDQLREEINSLAGRIDNVRETSETLATRAQTQAVQTSQAELRAIEGRIVGLINEAKQSINAAQVGPQELQRFRQEIDKINARFEQAASSPAPTEDVTALKVAVEQLSTRVAQGHDQRPIADLDRKIFEIAKKLEQAEAAARALPQANDLEKRFAELDQRLTQSLANPGQHSGAVEQKLVEVDERLARTEHQLGHLQTIERAISQLYDSMETMRNQTHDIANAAATRLISENAMQPAPQPVSLAGSNEITALETGLKAVREAAAAADTRNQETLEAVHETLEQIVSKLSELESVAVGQRLSIAATSTVGKPVHTHAPVAPAHAAQEYVADAHTPSHMDSPFLGSAQQALNSQPETLAAQHAIAPDPVLPGLEAAAPSLTNSDNGITDIVAAARRLHQASRVEKNNLGGIKNGALAGATEKKGFTIPFLGARSAKQTAATAPKSPIVEGFETTQRPLFAGLRAAQANDSSRKRLVLVGVLLLVLAGVGIRTLQSRVGHLPMIAPATIEQTTPKVNAPAAPQLSNPESAPLMPQDSKTKANVNPAQQGEATGLAPIGDPILTGAVAPPNASSVANTVVASTVPSNTSVSIETAVGPAKLRQAAEAGDTTAQFVVATHYLEGDTTTIDFAKAAYWYGKAAASGSAPAQYRLASLYERGKGVSKNLSSALNWYEKAASLGNVKAMHNAAVIAAGTDIGQPDYTKAFRFFSLAASHGLKDSQYNLAVLIERGLGTKADANDALFWFMAAAAQGDTEAKTRVDALSKTISAATLDSVKNRFKTWTPEKAPEAANNVSAKDSQWNPAKAAEAAPVAKIPANLNDQTKSLLAGLGYQVGVLDGTLDSRTASSIRLFQIKKGMKVTGQATPELVSELQS